MEAPGNRLLRLPESNVNFFPLPFNHESNGPTERNGYQKVTALWKITQKQWQNTVVTEIVLSSRFQPWTSCATPKYDRNVSMVSMAFLCIFAFRIKVLNANPCAVCLFIYLFIYFLYLIVQTTAANMVAEKRFSVLLSPINAPRNVCHRKIARQVARNITMSNTPNTWTLLHGPLP